MSRLRRWKPKTQVSRVKPWAEVMAPFRAEDKNEDEDELEDEDETMLFALETT